MPPHQVDNVFEHIRENGDWKPFPNEKTKKLMSTVGSTGPKGFHARCSWCIGCRWRQPKVNSCWGEPNKLPEIIFVCCMSFHFFYDKIYPYIPKGHPYILIIADEDTTIPRNIDLRFKPVLTSKMWDDIVANLDIIHIFASHLDIPKTDRYSPIPVGFNPTEHLDKDVDTLFLTEVDNDIMTRPLTIIGTCRIRKGPQWADRERVKHLALHSEWSKFSDWRCQGVEKSIFFSEIQKYSFIFCPHGGGLEPNPKVFTAIYCCTIPIIKRFVNCEILYKDLPVIFIDDWKIEYINLQNLSEWRKKLLHYFNGVERQLVLQKLTGDHWMEYIKNVAAEARRGQDESQIS